MNLEKFTSLLDNLFPLKINSDLCNKVITPKTSCNKCAELCPTKSLHFKNNVWKVDDCLLCGLCVTNCQNNVFKLDEDLLLHKCSLDNNLIISCLPFLKKIKTKNNHFISINCLSQISSEILVELLQNTKNTVFFIDTDQCLNCLGFTIQLLREKVNSLHISINNWHVIKDTSNLQAFLKTDNNKKEIAYNSRRLFLQSVFSGAKEIPQNIINSTFTNLALDDKKTSVTSRRKYVFKALAHKKIDTHKLLPYKYLNIKNCSFCETCVKLCPTKALQLEEDNVTKTIFYYPQLCTECNICIDVCFFKGIYWDENIDIKTFIKNEPLEIAKATRKNCQNCAQYFWQVPKDIEYCFLCNRARILPIT